jgi:hypothetical protein
MYLNYDKLNIRYWYAIVIIAYLVLAAVFLDTAAIGLNPDLIAYLNIAQKYSEGHFTEAVNGYWSPMISWLLTPVFWLRLDPLLGFKILNILTGLGILLLVISFLKTLFTHWVIKAACYLVIAAFCFTYQYNSQTPDLLSAFFLLGYLRQFLADDFYSRRNFYLYAGIWAACCYFVKSYMFVFCLAQMIAVTVVCLLLRKELRLRKIIAKQMFNTVLVFLLVALPWLAALGGKYGEPMLSSAPKYNSTVFTPQGDTLHYTSYAGLIPPADKYALFGWEDPSYFKVEGRKIFDSEASWQYQLGIIKFNTWILQYMFRYYSYAGIWLVPFLLLVFFLKNDKAWLLAIILLLSAGIYISGYYLIFIKERYLIPAHLLLLLCSFYTLEQLLQKLLPARNEYIRGAFTAVMVVVLIKNPVSVFLYSKKVFAEEQKSVALAYRLQQEEWFRNVKFATPAAESGLYNFLPLSALLSGSRFYGELSPHDTDDVHLRELKKYHIDYLFYLGCARIDGSGNCESKELPAYLKDMPVVFEDPEEEVTIFGLR